MLSCRITMLRHSLGMSQKELAQKLHISASAEGMYEQGRRTPSIEILINMTRLFGVSLDYLITGEESVASGQNAKGTNKMKGCPCAYCFHRCFNINKK